MTKVIPRVRLLRDDDMGVALHWGDTTVALEAGHGLRGQLLTALAGLFEAGAELRFEALRPEGVTMDAGLAT